MRDNGDGTKRILLLVGALLAMSALGLLGKSLLSTAGMVFTSFFLAALIASVSKKASKKTGIPYPPIAGILTVLLFLFIGGILAAVAVRLVRECGELVIWLSEHTGAEGSPLGFTSVVRGFFDRIAFFQNNEGAKAYFERLAESLIKESASALGKRMAAVLGSILHATPRAVMRIFVFIMSTFYFSVDYFRICEGIKRIIPKAVLIRLSAIWGILLRTLRGYMKAYFILFVITFCQLFAGLFILKVRFAFLISLGIAAIDIFPVLGSGIILVPWAVCSFCIHDSRLGTGLLVLYGIVTIVRQIAEPRIVGDGLGIHPLASLLCMFLGVSAFGILGAVIGPFVAVAVKELVFCKNKKM